ncbi:polyphosphoinositide phosphatase isoform X2 [Neocloeon triangulifer]|uniref:polyphosphoinositide phosphatase isoform X2 n=1 Tax=Neocloeon triangulifer TaxID=2078957 RepID=UPI00286EC958|nr:polyphosphoinositide phosphatase isoform X2 [Neocloeon triangulifer]
MDSEMNPNCFGAISPIQKIALYETKSRFYLLGSNNSQTRCRVLKIDRMEPKALNITDDNILYSKDQIKDLVNMIDSGNRSKTGQRSTGSGICKVVSAFGIVGFIRFLEGYYIILITKRTRIAVIGNHSVYKIEDTSMIYIPNEGIRHYHPDESRYVKMFQNIYLSSNFYFSYSYDITNTLQCNMTPVTNSDILKGLQSGEQNFVFKCVPNERFIWNNYLLKDARRIVHSEWIIDVVHGFVGQSNLSIYGRSIYITVIARRSNKFAGTRFLKRGANFQGDVANEVETEQIVHDSKLNRFEQGYFSSFVQMRGSIPTHWSQTITNIKPKPVISIDIPDPFAITAGNHFNNLFLRYGTPVIILNLVKKREKKKQESLLSEEYMNSVKYLNQFLPPEHHIQYTSFDMARKNKKTGANVMGWLDEIAYNAVCKTGIFTSNEINGNSGPFQELLTTLGQPGGGLTGKGRLQCGIVRVNCVDCLDRTNTAQFALGRCALGFQLCALGALNRPKLDFDTDCVRLLESLYEDHGDTLALQYGGSQLVHRIKTYRKTSPWTSQGNDIMQTISRYCRNTFSDTEKQRTMNLFLGLFVPKDDEPPIWEMASDNYLHHPETRGDHIPVECPLTKWWGNDVMEALPRPLYVQNKPILEISCVKKGDERVDCFFDFYRPYELHNFDDMFAFKMTHSVRDFMPHFTTNCSPFVIRGRPGKHREDTTNKNPMRNPSLTGSSSTSSTTSSTSSSFESESDGEASGDFEIVENPSNKSVTSFRALFPSMEETYGTRVKEPEANDIAIYDRYAKMHQKSQFLADTPHVIQPVKVQVSSDSLQVYKNYVAMRNRISVTVPQDSLKTYQNYVKSLQGETCVI